MAGPGATSTDISWWSWFVGLMIVVWDLLTQKFRARHLPTRIPLPQLQHLTCIVTGATGGIGLQVARCTRRPGCPKHHGRQGFDSEMEKGAAEKGGLERGKLNAEVMELDLMKLSSIHSFAEAWEARKIPLNVLINNAGVFAMNVKQTFSEDGFEQHLQVNHLGSALLSLLLLPSLLRGAPARIINVNSVVHHIGHVDPEDLNCTKRKYSSAAAYSGSKLAQLLFSRVLHMMIPSEAGIDVFLVHPGVVVTGVSRTLPKIIQDAQKLVTFPRLTPAEDKQVYGFARALREMGHPVAPYFSSNCQPANVASQANDMENAKKVWDKTLANLQLPAGIVQDQLQREDNKT